MRTMWPSIAAAPTDSSYEALALQLGIRIGTPHICRIILQDYKSIIKTGRVVVVVAAAPKVGGVVLREQPARGPTPQCIVFASGVGVVAAGALHLEIPTFNE